MSRGASITLGVASLLIAVGFMAVPPTPGMSMSGLRLAGAFCALIALACLVPRSRPVTARLIAAVVLGLCVWYVYSMWNGPMTSGRRTQPSLVNAIAAFTFFGLPAAYVLLRGFVPRWHGAASITPESDDANAVGDLWRSRIGSGPVTIEGFALTSDEANAFAREFTARHRTTLSRWHRLAVTIGALIIVGLEFWFFVSQRWSPGLAGVIITVSLIGFFVAFAWLGLDRSRTLQRTILAERGYPICVGCGYNLQGSGMNNSCPECGWQRAMSSSTPKRDS